MNKDRLYLESISDCLERIAGMRNVLIHNYLKVNLARVWRTVITDLPPVRELSPGS